MAPAIRGLSRQKPISVAADDLRQLASFTKPHTSRSGKSIELHRELATGRWTMFDVLHADARRFDLLHAHSRQLHRLVDFAVLGAAFYVSCMLFSVESGSALFIHMLAYSTILLVCVRLSRRAIANCYQSIGESTRKILGNAIGVLIGTCIVLPLAKLLPNQIDFTPAIIISGALAFFVLGTLCSLVHKTSLANK